MDRTGDLQELHVPCAGCSTALDSNDTCICRWIFGALRKEMRGSQGQSQWSHTDHGVYLSTYLCPGFPWEAWPCSHMMKCSSNCSLHWPLRMETLEHSLTCCFVFKASILRFTLNKFSQFLVCIKICPLKAQISRSHPQGFWPSES